MNVARIPVRLLSLLLMSVLLSIGSMPAAQAQASTITVSPLWQPGDQLTSIPGDTRYVDLQLHALGNVQFWAVDLVCQFGNGTQLINPVLTWGAAWGTGNVDFIPFTPTGFYTGGALRIAASRAGVTTPPLGVNGASYNLLLLTVRFQVENLPAAASVTPVCSQLHFLNRNGELITAATLTPVDRLALTRGYNLRGVARRQASASSANIEVSCVNQPTGHVYTTMTTATGSYSFSGTTAAPLRDTGLYACTYTSKLNGTLENTTYLQERVIIDLQTPEYLLLPVLLKTGDIETVTSPNSITVNQDAALVTANWRTTPGAPYSPGDATGDGLVNRTDLAVVAGNAGLSDASGGLLSGRVVYGLARDYAAVFPNSKLWWGDASAGAVQPLFTLATRVFWPAVAPDGTEIVYTSVDAAGKYKLFKALMPAGPGAAFTPAAFTGEAFAPSWSPDGKRYAFICSWKDAISGYEYNEGDICLMNASSSGGSALTTVVRRAKIFPAAWVTNTMFIYAGVEAAPGNQANPACSNRLCYYDIATGTSGAVPMDVTLLAGNNRVDMPLIRHYATGESFLFYRLFDGGALNYRLHTGKLVYTGGTITGGITGPLTSGTHEMIENTTGVDYYDVSPTLDVMYYLFNALDFRNLRLQTTGSDFTWSGITSHYVDGFTGNPNAVSGSNVLWDGNLNNPTLLHALRAAYDWLP